MIKNTYLLARLVWLFFIRQLTSPKMFNLIERSEKNDAINSRKHYTWTDGTEMSLDMESQLCSNKFLPGYIQSWCFIHGLMAKRMKTVQDFGIYGPEHFSSVLIWRRRAGNVFKEKQVY